MQDVVLMDGAVGTSLWEKTNDASPVWRYNIERPQLVAELIDEYIAAGSKIVLANSFAANATNMKGTPYNAADVVSRAVSIAREASAGRAKVMLSIGPLNYLLEPYGDLTAEEAYAIFDEQITAGVKAGADMIFAQTFIDLELMKIALKAARKHDLPLFCAFSFDKTGHTMMGNTVEGILEGVKEFNLDAVGLNCSLGPDLAVPVIKQFHELTDMPLIFKPNAGKPIAGEGQAAEFDVETFVNDVLPALDYGVKYVGGCCGSNPKYIKRLGERIAERG